MKTVFTKQLLRSFSNFIKLAFSFNFSKDRAREARSVLIEEVRLNLNFLKWGPSKQAHNYLPW
jgi:hypothetical protein